MGLRYSIDRAIISFCGRLLRSRKMYDSFFEDWRIHFDRMQALGLHVMPVHYLSPVPDTRALSPELWKTRSAVPGVKICPKRALTLLDIFARDYRKEYDAFPREKNGVGFYLNNGAYGSVDAEILYAVVRHFKPKRIIEIGSGFTSMVTSMAVLANRAEGHDCEFTAIEPYPKEALRTGGLPGLTRLIEKKVEDVPLSEFERLEENDFLFIDSTHVLRIGSDVQYEFMELVPRVKKGVVVHVHDIFIPGEYPKKWIEESRFFWNEQYLLQAFLAFNDAFEVLWPGYMMHLDYPAALAAAIASYSPEGSRPASFWMTRTK